MKLWPSALCILEHLKANTDAELERAEPGGWWLGNKQVWAPACWLLVRLMLIRETDSDESLLRFTISDNGLKALDDPACPR